MRFHRFRLAVLCALVSTLAACAQPSIPEDRFYRLPASAAADRAARLPAGVIQVERFVGDGLTAGRAIAYSNAATPDVAQTYHYHLWIEPPTILLQTALVDALKRAGAAQVVTPEIRIEPKTIVTGRIRAFEHVRGAQGAARVKLDLAMSERADGRIVVLKSYTAELPTSGSDIGAAIAGFGAAVDQIYSQFIKDIAAP